jgi:hypothetical protein
LAPLSVGEEILALDAILKRKKKHETLPVIIDKTFAKVSTDLNLTT